MYQNVIIPYLYEAQHVSGCQVEYTLPDSVQQLHAQQPSMCAKPEAASAVLGF